jgi:hypothetical protein
VRPGRTGAHKWSPCRRRRPSRCPSVHVVLQRAAEPMRREFPRRRRVELQRRCRWTVPMREAITVTARIQARVALTTRALLSTRGAPDSGSAIY